MNIPPIESLLADLDEARRQRNASNRRIEELTDALETQQRVIKQAHEDIAKLTTERDELKAQWAYYQDFCKSHNAKGITDLVVQRDAALAEVEKLHKENEALLTLNDPVYKQMKSALREAKEAIEYCIIEAGGVCEHDAGVCLCVEFKAIATINKVLGEE